MTGSHQSGQTEMRPSIAFAGGRAVAIWAALLGVALVLNTPLLRAQPAANSSTGVPNALQGFSQNRGQPVQIEASSLEVRDKDKKAVFTGNVKVVQGDTTMRCKSMVVFYDQQGGPDARVSTKTAKGGATGPAGSSQISKMEAQGGVIVTQKDQTATGDTGYFDMKANTVMLVGNVIISQGQNVVRGERLTVDLTSGTSRVEAGKGPVRMLIHQQPKSDAPGAAGSPNSPLSLPGSRPR